MKFAVLRDLGHPIVLLTTTAGHSLDSRIPLILSPIGQSVQSISLSKECKKKKVALTAIIVIFFDRWKRLKG